MSEQGQRVETPNKDGVHETPDTVRTDKVDDVTSDTDTTQKQTIFSVLGERGISIAIGAVILFIAASLGLGYAIGNDDDTVKSQNEKIASQQKELDKVPGKLVTARNEGDTAGTNRCRLDAKDGKNWARDGKTINAASWPQASACFKDGYNAEKHVMGLEAEQRRLNEKLAQQPEIIVLQSGPKFDCPTFNADQLAQVLREGNGGELAQFCSR